MKGMTTPDSFDAQPGTSNRAVLCNGVYHVFRTRGAKSTGGWQQRRNEALVAGKEDQDRALHFTMTLAVSRHRSSNVASITLRFGLKTTAQSFGATGRLERTASRI